MTLPKVNYDPGTGAVDLAFTRGPIGFACFYSGRVHDNLSTSGAARERVVEGIDMLIVFSMPALLVAELAAWTAFSRWALAGGQFSFYPAAGGVDFYHCLSDDQVFRYSRVGPGVYSAPFAWRIVPDAQAPSGPDVVMEKFYGL